MSAQAAAAVLAQIADAELPGFPEDRLPGLNERCGAFEEIALHICAIWGDPDACRALVEAGSEINVPGEYRYTPLHEAASRGCTDIVALLLEYGANSALTTDLGTTVELAMDHPETLALLNASPSYRPLSADELPTLLSWAQAEGWNPGRADVDAFLAADPDGFHAMEIHGELIGGAATVVYDGRYGFVGLFIVKPEWRGRGWGLAFWRYFIEQMKWRIGAEGGAALDGVFAMQENYAKSGFRFSHRNLRMQGRGSSAPLHPSLVHPTTLPFTTLAAYDLAHFGAHREAFLKHWIIPEGGRALAYLEGGTFRGYGVIRPCHDGAKIGPLFADTPEIAEALFRGLSTSFPDAPLFLDIPENNPEAVALAARHGMREVFGCARMTLGSAPELPWAQIYGLTTFELG